MKRYIRASVASRIAAAEKKVRQIIWTVWSCDENGNVVRNYSNPSMLKNVMMKRYADEDPGIGYTLWIYEQANDLFEDAVVDTIDSDDKMTDEIKEAALEYFYNLTPSDYARNLYLKRDEADFKRDGLRRFGY